MANFPVYISLLQAQEMTQQLAFDVPIETVTLESANGRILATDLESKVDDPPFDNSSMDGFACMFDSTQTPPYTLEIINHVQGAGEQWRGTLQPTQAMRIMTGAPMPTGANAILPIEQCEIHDNILTLNELPKPHFVRKKAENLRAGETILTKGTHLTPAQIGICATMGYPMIDVISKLTIGIISTGDELKSPGQPLLPGEIYESNSYGLVGLVEWLGHTARRYHASVDTIEDVRKALNIASEECDIILTSGGVSKGDFDYVRKLMEQEGEILFWRVKLRPGSPPVVGRWKGTPFFGLPGNPVSSHVVFRMIVAPYIRGLYNGSGPSEQKAFARLMDPVKSTNDCVTLRRVTLEFTPEGILAFQPRHQGSGNLESLASADGLTLLQPGQDADPGEIIEILIL